MILPNFFETFLSTLFWNLIFSRIPNKDPLPIIFLTF